MPHSSAQEPAAPFAAAAASFAAAVDASFAAADAPFAAAGAPFAAAGAPFPAAAADAPLAAAFPAGGVAAVDTAPAAAAANVLAALLSSCQTDHQEEAHNAPRSAAPRTEHPRLRTSISRPLPPPAPAAAAQWVLSLPQVPAFRSCGLSSKGGCSNTDRLSRGQMLPPPKAGGYAQPSAETGIGSRRIDCRHPTFAA
jgi:hypothetical protein